MSVYVFVLLITPWSPYNYNTSAAYKSMVFLISGVFRNNLFYFGGEGVSRASSKLNDIIKQSYILTEISGAARISSRGKAKFCEQHSPGAVVKPSESSHNRDIEVFLPTK